MFSNHEDYMHEALLEAKKAESINEVPIGAIIVDPDGNIISRAHNLRETEKRAIAHAELLAIDQACKNLGRWRLNDCTLYVTLEPCFMCAGAIVLARLKTVVFGAHDPKAGAVKSLANVLNDSRLNHNCEVITNISQNQCSHLLKDFFVKKRKK